ncbi:quinone oxidoreductase family protein [Nakamurella leprariae]|uniref:NADP-dependent oxidoreductase n=1 Tax=Nakamurella leprariae TaxID=2803911 RepID=A0A938YDB8_9ACTN|nr:NADP-dependent oxidoreductase [Nakamurella leprariae]MBM9468587.1 NADP-dependent oxidoreductase [Nakamurella leprariae]
MPDNGVRAVGVVEYGGPEALREVEVPREPLGAGQIRVKVTAATVNATDTYVVNGSRARGRDRSAGAADIPGMDIAGEVLEIGPDTDTDLMTGEKVMAIVLPTGEHGAYRSDLVLPAGSVVRVPKGFSDAQAATLPMNGLTARRALDLMDLQPGQVVAVTGAAGCFGGYVVQLAKADGLVVVADSSEQDEDLVRSLGADHVVRRGDDVADRIRELFPDGVDGLADGAVQDEKVLSAVKDDGAVATVRFWEGDGSRSLRFHPVRVGDLLERRDLLDRLREQAEQGVVTLRVADVVPAARASEAHERLHAGGVRGRLVLDFA